MIIKRKYATYGELYSDETTKMAIMQIFDEYKVKDYVREGVLNPNNDVLVFNTDMGMCIPSEAYKALRKKLDELDSTHPFDNHLTYRDVTNIMNLPSRKGAAILQIMYRKKAEMPIQIVQAIAFEYKNGEMEFIEPWDFGTVILN